MKHGEGPRDRKLTGPGPSILILVYGEGSPWVPVGGLELRFLGIFWIRIWGDPNEGERVMWGGYICTYVSVWAGVYVCP